MIGSEMEVVVIDGQGGGIGRSVIEALKKEVSGTFIIAVGTNSTATNNMKKVELMLSQREKMQLFIMLKTLR